VHFLRNALDYLPRKVADDCLIELRCLYDRRNAEEAHGDLTAWLLRWQESIRASVGGSKRTLKKRRGALLYTLMQYPQLTLFPLNSKPPESFARPCERAGPKTTAGIAACKPNWSSTFTISDPPLRPQITSSQRSQGLGLHR
jgi:hypothetical protein